MSVLYVLVPVALGLVLLAVGAYVWSVQSGQFDDLDTPALRPLIDDDGGPARARESKTAAGIAKPGH
jgi:cbb3-type cytochrome oxidase maturation protein